MRLQRPLQLLLQHCHDERGADLVDVVRVLEVLRIGQRVA